MNRILIVEDEPLIRDELNILLSNAGFSTACVTDFTTTLRQIRESSPDLILLDIGLPGQDGYRLCTEIRRFSEVPVLFLTARDTAMDELQALTLGGDDYISKPYNIPILLARINALLKRSQSADRPECIAYRGFHLNLVSGTISFGEREAELTRTELKILYYLFRRPGEIVPRICYVCIAGGTLLCGRLRQRQRIRYLNSLMDSLDQKYLFAELADTPASGMERVYSELMRTALRSMTDEVASCRRQNREYREFIEQWVHEIKLPVTGIELLCENNKTDVTRRILSQTEQISQSVKRVLYYARLGSVEKDYMITEVSLKACVLDVLARNRQFLIQNQVCARTDDVSGFVYSDQKWLSFLLNQLIQNSIKYKSSRPPVLEFVSAREPAHVTLSLTDNGIGIRESELGRVFDKGFVGSNGRNRRNATGIGLWLCDQLCRKLGIGITISSEEGVSTTVSLHFPVSDHLRV